MTQEKFDEYFRFYDDDQCNALLDKEQFCTKSKEAFRVTIVLLEMAFLKEDMTNWHLYAEKYLLGMNEENKEIPKEE